MRDGAPMFSWELTISWEFSVSGLGCAGRDARRPFPWRGEGTLESWRGLWTALCTGDDLGVNRDPIRVLSIEDTLICERLFICGPWVIALKGAWMLCVADSISKALEVGRRVCPRCAITFPREA